MPLDFDTEQTSATEPDDAASFQFEPRISAREIPRWRHAVALFILLGFISFIAWTNFQFESSAQAENPILPSTSGDLLTQTAFHLFFFGAFWCAAWAFSRASKDDLFLRWRGTWQNFALGFGYSIGLRFVVAGVAIFVLLCALLSGITVDEIIKFVKSFSPAPERMVSLKALSNDPLYRFLMVTWVSFIVAGLREELWRVAVIAACTKVFSANVLKPRFSARGAQIFGVVLSSVFFGMAHYIQGWIAVGMTMVLGLSLGAITLAHRSIWPAIIAHGAFDALTFLLLPLASSIQLPPS